MPRRPIYKHAGIIVKVKKEKEEKKRSKESHYPNKEVNNFTVTLWGMRQKTSIFVPLTPKGLVCRVLLVPTVT